MRSAIKKNIYALLIWSYSLYFKYHERHRSLHQEVLLEDNDKFSFTTVILNILNIFYCLFLLLGSVTQNRFLLLLEFIRYSII